MPLLFASILLVLLIKLGGTLRFIPSSFPKSSNKMTMSNMNKVENSFQTIAIKKPEILSPAGGWPQLKAAVVNGADAVYFGLRDGFNARARAINFPVEELPDVINYLHDRGVKGYLVLNVLVFDEEFTRLRDLVPKIARSGVDALIMQDIGAIGLVRSIAPNLPIHGSTQMSITDAKGVQFTKSLNLGVERIVVGRELSVNEIALVHKDKHNEIELEAFVHGALCVSYSGQCFSSEAWGGRSANRGQCAQACRMPYSLVVNGTIKALKDDAKYLLSPQDLMAVDLVPQLIQAGVSSFKIEGRLKGPEYVAITTAAYRQAVDEAWSLIETQQHSLISDADKSSKEFIGPDESMRRDLRQVFARGQDEDFDGLSRGFLEGSRHQSLVRGLSPRHRGNIVGKVVGASKKGVSVQVLGAIKRGDGVVFDQNQPEVKEEGGLVYEIFDKSEQSVGIGAHNEVTEGIHTLTFAKGAIDMSRIKVGNIIWRNKDPALDNRLSKLMQKGDNQLVAIKAYAIGAYGTPLSIKLVDGEGREAIGHSSVQLEHAKKTVLSQAAVDQAVGQLGDTSFFLDPNSLGNVDLSALDDGLFIPLSEIKEARRKAVKELISKRREHNRDQGLSEDGDLKLMGEQPVFDSSAIETFSPLNEEQSAKEPQLTVLCRTPEQVTAACSIPWLSEIYLDFLEVHGLREAVAQVRRANKKVVVATPRIFKPEEQRLWLFYLRLRADALLVRSAGFLQQMLDFGGTGAFVPAANTTIPTLYGDFSLNAANTIAAKMLLETGLSRITPTHDLNANQIAEMVFRLGSSNKRAKSAVECIIHQHLPIFHTEHCVFCRFLSSGNNYLDCGKPCERNNVDLRDVNGLDHVVLADQGCRNTVFNAQAQSGAEFIETFLSSGIRHFRIELVTESADHVGLLLNKYRSLLMNAGAADSAESLLNWVESLPNRNGVAQGVSAGSLMPSLEREWSTLKPSARR